MTRSALRPRHLAAAFVMGMPLVVYFALIGRWSLDGDEYYTYVDSAQPVADLLRYEIKPLYYLICHVLLEADLDVSLEWLLRAPAALAAGLIAPISYWMLAAADRPRSALLTAILLLANPWIFELSQFARFYSMMLLFATIATIALYRWLGDPRTRWLVVFVVAAALATAAHTTAGVLVPAGLGGLFLASLQRDRETTLAFIRKSIFVVAPIGAFLAVVAWWVARPQITLWLGSEAGLYGNYSAIQILVALAIHGGLPLWALAWLPLAKAPARWLPEEILLAAIVVLAILPFLVLSTLGGGIASRYALASLPAAFILAGRHWAAIDRKIGSKTLRVAAAAAILAYYVPYLASISRDGNHFDYRGAARVVDSMLRDDTLVVSSARLMLGHYLDDPREIEELETFENGVPRERIGRFLADALAEGRPVILVSREDRTELSASDQDWLFERFSLKRSFRSQRFDHRRFRMSIYESRPSVPTEHGVAP